MSNLTALRPNASWYWKGMYDLLPKRRSSQDEDFQPTQPEMHMTSASSTLHVADPVIDDVPPQPADVVPTKALPSIMPARFAVDRGAGAGLEPLRGVESMEEARATIKKQVTAGTSAIVYIYELAGAEMAVQSSASLNVDQVEQVIKGNLAVLGS